MTPPRKITPAKVAAAIGVLLLSGLAGAIAFFTTCFSVDALVTSGNSDPYASLSNLPLTLAFSAFVGVTVCILVIAFLVRRAKQTELARRESREKGAKLFDDE